MELHHGCEFWAAGTAAGSLWRWLLPLDAHTELAAQTPTPPDAIEKLVVRLEQAMAAGDRAALIGLAVKDTDASTLDEFAAAAGEKPTRVVIKERDRQTLDNNKRQLLLEVFVERGIEGAARDVAPRSQAAGAEGQSRRLAHRTHRAGLERLGPLSPRAQHHAPVRRAQSGAHRDRI